MFANTPTTPIIAGYGYSCDHTGSAYGARVGLASLSDDSGSASFYKGGQSPRTIDTKFYLYSDLIQALVGVFQIIL